MAGNPKGRPRRYVSYISRLRDDGLYSYACLAEIFMHEEYLKAKRERERVNPEGVPVEKFDVRRKIFDALRKRVLKEFPESGSAYFVDENGRKILGFYGLEWKKYYVKNESIEPQGVIIDPRDLKWKILYNENKDPNRMLKVIESKSEEKQSPARVLKTVVPIPKENQDSTKKHKNTVSEYKERKRYYKTAVFVAVLLIGLVFGRVTMKGIYENEYEKFTFFELITKKPIQFVEKSIPPP